MKRWLHRIFALLFGGLFVYAGVQKLRDPMLFLSDVRSFDILPDPYAAFLALGLPWLEVFAGLAVISGVMRNGGLLLLNGALVVFCFALGSAWHRGINIQCGCFGGSAVNSNYIELFIRDGLLLALGLALLVVEWRCRNKSSSPA